MRKSLIVLLALTALAGAACGNDNPTVPNSPGPTVTTTVADETTPPTESPQCDDQTGAATAEVTLSDNFFEPDCFIVDASAGLHLVNNGAAPHTFTIDNSPVDFEVAAGTDESKPGPSPLAPGEYVFYCRFHGSPAGGMKGTVTVV